MHGAGTENRPATPIRELGSELEKIGIISDGLSPFLVVLEVVMKQVPYRMWPRSNIVMGPKLGSCSA
jgi:hypothetical protein